MNKRSLCSQQPSSALAKRQKGNARSKKCREKNKENERKGFLFPNTTQLLVCGNKEINSQNNERREMFMNYCNRIINERSKRNGSTTYTGIKNVIDKNVLPTHFYHQISFFSDKAKKIYSLEKEVNSIKPLADRETIIDLKKMHSYEETDFLSFICSILCESIQSKRTFNGILNSSDYVKKPTKVEGTDGK